MRKVIPGLKFRIFLDLFYFLTLPAALLLYAARRKYHRGLIERVCFGRWVEILKNDAPFVWIHAVSLGEARLAGLLYGRLKKEFPNFKYILTTITPAGEKFLKSQISASDYVSYLPLDISFLMRRIFSKLNIKMVLILETEIWPNFIIEAKKNNVLLGLVNARISQKAYPRYKLLKPLLKNVLNLFDFVSPSGEITKKRLLAMGLDKERFSFTGTMKFDLNIPPTKEDYRIKSFKESLGKSNSNLLLAGSTHRGEDILVFDRYIDLLKTYSNLKLLIAPRHFTKLDRLVSHIQKKGFSAEFFSAGFKFSPKAVFILDEIGFLPSLYSLADLVFIGGSLVSYGGHNVIEPAIFSKAIITGEHYFNFEEIVLSFKKEDAILIAQTGQLGGILNKLLASSSARTEMGIRAHDVILKNKGALDKVLSEIRGRLK